MITIGAKHVFKYIQQSIIMSNYSYIAAIIFYKYYHYDHRNT